MKPPAIILDADLVLLDYMAQFERYMSERHGIGPSVPWSEETSYGSLSMMYPSLPRPASAYFAEMSVEPGYFGCIPFIEGAEKGVADLRRLHPDSPLVCVTAAGTHPSTLAMRSKNLEPFGFEHLIVLPLGAAKADVFASYAPGCWVVDDVPAHVASAEAAGHVGILFSQPTNRHVDHPMRAADWSDVVSILSSGNRTERRYGT